MVPLGIVDMVTNYVTNHPFVFVVAFVVYVGMYVWSFQPKSGPNPFAKDAARTPEPLVTDTAARDKVLKQGFVAKRIPEQLDVIVIGSGIAGLTAATLLSRADKTVLVLEQHDQAGGACHSFIEGGYEFEPGVHYLGELDESRFMGKLLHQLTEGQLQWDDMEDELDVMAIGAAGAQTLYAFNGKGKEEWKRVMLENFPEEEKALDKWLHLLAAARRSTRGFLMLKVLPKWLLRALHAVGMLARALGLTRHAARTTQHVLDSLTTNMTLQAALCFNFGDYGTKPAESSFFMQALLTNHYIYGAKFPRGGSSEIPFHLVRQIEKAGGRVLVRAEVSKILTDSSGTVIGVRVNRGEGVDVFAPLVISDAGVTNTLKYLLPEKIAKRSSLYKHLGVALKPGPCVTYLFVGLRGTPAELGLKAQNIWSYLEPDLNKCVEKMNGTLDEITSSEPWMLFISFPTAKDTSAAERYPGKCAITAVTWVNWQCFAQWADTKLNKRGEEYEAYKKRLGDMMWQRVLALYPHLEDKVEYFNVGTPLSHNHYLGTHEGDVYGLDHPLARFADPNVIMDLRPDIDIPGLLLTGQDIFSSGVMSSLVTGFLGAGKALNRNLMKDLGALFEQIAKRK